MAVLLGSCLLVEKNTIKTLRMGSLSWHGHLVSGSRNSLPLVGGFPRGVMVYKEYKFVPDAYMRLISIGKTACVAKWENYGTESVEFKPDPVVRQERMS